MSSESVHASLLGQLDAITSPQEAMEFQRRLVSELLTQAVDHDDLGAAGDRGQLTCGVVTSEASSDDHHALLLFHLPPPCSSLVAPSPGWLREG